MYDIIVNPHGGKGESLNALQTVEETLKANGAEYTVHRTEYAGHAMKIARELNRTKDELKLIAMGGDGTFHEVLSGIDDFSKVTLGIVPCGSGNDFIKVSGHSLDCKTAVETILKDQPSYVDFIQVGDQRSLNVAGAGMDVDVLLKYATYTKLPAKLAYNLALVHTLLHCRFHRMKIAIDGGDPMERNVFMIGVGNGRYIGGGMPVCPHSEIEDGKLDIVIINELKKSKFPVTLIKFLKGRHTELPFTEEFRCEKCNIQVLDDSRFEFDGEVQPEDMKTLDFQCVHDTLKMYR